MSNQQDTFGQPPRLSTGTDFPYGWPGRVCFVHVSDSGQVSQIQARGDMRAFLANPSGQLFAAWPGQWRTDLFLVDHTAMADALGIEQTEAAPTTRRRITSDLIGLHEAADRCGLHYRTIRRYIAEGRLNAVRVGPRLLKVNAADVDGLQQPVPASPTPIGATA